MDNKRKLELAKELFKRKKQSQYKSDFELFAKEQIRIITKNASQGFIPFEFNAAQSYTNGTAEPRTHNKIEREEDSQPRRDTTTEEEPKLTEATGEREKEDISKTPQKERR